MMGERVEGTKDGMYRCRRPESRRKGRFLSRFRGGRTESMDESGSAEMLDFSTDESDTPGPDKQEHAEKKDKEPQEEKSGGVGIPKFETIPERKKRLKQCWYNGCYCISKPECLHGYHRNVRRRINCYYKEPLTHKINETLRKVGIEICSKGWGLYHTELDWDTGEEIPFVYRGEVPQNKYLKHFKKTGKFPSEKWLMRRAREWREGKYDEMQKRYDKYGDEVMLLTKTGSGIPQKYPEFNRPPPDPEKLRQRREMLKNMTFEQRMQFAKEWFGNSTLFKLQNKTVEEMFAEIKRNPEELERLKKYRTFLNDTRYTSPLNFDDLMPVPPDWKPGPNDVFDFRVPFYPTFVNITNTRIVKVPRPPVFVAQFQRKGGWPGKEWPAQYKKPTDDGEISPDSEDQFMKYMNDLEQGKDPDAKKRPKRKLLDVEGFFREMERKANMTRRQRARERNPIRKFSWR